MNMLVQKELNENQGDTFPFKTGDTVKVVTSGQVGQIVGFEDGKWLVKLINESVVPADSTELEKRQVLLG